MRFLKIVGFSTHSQARHRRELHYFSFPFFLLIQVLMNFTWALKFLIDIAWKFFFFKQSRKFTIYYYVFKKMYFMVDSRVKKFLRKYVIRGPLIPLVNFGNFFLKAKLEMSAAKIKFNRFFTHKFFYNKLKVFNDLTTRDLHSQNVFQ